MGSGQISMTSESLQGVQKDLFETCNKYKENLSKLEGVINQITSGDFTGEAARDLLEKYNAKKDEFERLRRIIDENEEYMKNKEARFNRMQGDLIAEFK